MKPVTLNLASHPFRNNTLVALLLGVVGAALATATLTNLYVFLNYGHSYARLQLEQAQDRAKIAQLESEEKADTEQIRARDFRKVYERGKLASELIRKSAFSWTLLFNTLETVVPPDVVMTAIRPNISAEGIVIRIEGVAKHHMALLTFEDRLQRHNSFSKVFPQSERRLNPSLPDITFLLTCDYLPERATAPPEQVAANAPGDASASPATTAPEQNAAPAATGAPASPGAPATTGVTASGPETAGGSAPVAPVVGRDGRPRGGSGSARTIVAPGAIFVATAEAKPAARAATASGAPPAAKPPAPRAAVSTAPAAPAAAPAATPAPGTSSGAIVAAGGSSATQASPLPAPTAPPRGDPNDPRTATPRQQAARSVHQKVMVGSSPAQRLDIPLSFNRRTVAEIYDRLGRAHGVRFDLDPHVERDARVTVNLQGRNLEDAIALMKGMAHHRILRVADGVYRVEPADLGESIREAPVVEETLPTGGRP